MQNDKIKYTKPPLPFYGNKSKIKNELIPIIKSLPDEQIYIDLFGGSFYLSYLIKILKPISVVICNDYDNYLRRIELIPQTNQILEAINNTLDTSILTVGEILLEDDSKLVKNILSKYEDDDLLTLFSKLTYSSSFYSTKSQLLQAKLYYRAESSNSKSR